MRLTCFIATLLLGTNLLLAEQLPPAGNRQETKEEGFVPIFDGKTLNGWQGVAGSTDSYYVEDGMLICKADGHEHIFTKKKFSNFILRIEIKLEPGGNNGVGIRTKISKVPHLEGMEIQVLDDPYYADGKPIKLKPYQHYGSIYGIVPAKTGHLKPTGQWNQEEIVCNGRRVKVTLNGTVIVNADLDKIPLPTMDGQDHPGLKYNKGRISFHAHGNYGARVFFRNIRVKMVTGQAATGVRADSSHPAFKAGLAECDIVGLTVAPGVSHSPATPAESVSAKLAFTSKKNGEYAFNTGVLRGKLRLAGKSLGLSSVVHVPSGVRLDRSAGILSYYRIFTTNKRYGSAAWDWPSTSKMLSDGAVQITWSEGRDRPFEMVAIYRFKDSSTLDVETIVRPRKDLSKFEIFLASYFYDTFPSPYVYVAGNPQAQGKPGFLMARKSFGDWQMFPRNQKILQVIHDGRWQKEPNPVKWTIMPHMGMPIALRRSTKTDLTVLMMAPLDDCFAIATPYQGESHYSLYLSLFGCDVKAGETARARSRCVVTTTISDREILDLYQKYMKDLADCTIPKGVPKANRAGK